MMTLLVGFGMIDFNAFVMCGITCRLHYCCVCFADFIQSGELDSHIRKVIKVYKARRDLFCELLSNELSNFFEFEIPKGGMAVWTKLKSSYSWEEVSKIARNQIGH